VLWRCKQQQKSSLAYVAHARALTFSLKGTLLSDVCTSGSTARNGRTSDSSLKPGMLALADSPKPVTRPGRQLGFGCSGGNPSAQSHLMGSCPMRTDASSQQQGKHTPPFNLQDGLSNKWEIGSQQPRSRV
jgi:hypothetical protein